MDDVLGPAAVGVDSVYHDVEGVQSGSDLEGEVGASVCVCGNIGGGFNVEVALCRSAGQVGEKVVVGDRFVNGVQDLVVSGIF